jgi:2-methylisocitrate lyase-like PEP mutase family enzyme
MPRRPAPCRPLGFADHEGTPASEMFAAVTRIVAAVQVPVTADLEHGYGLTPADLVEQIGQTGAAGCNLEDSDPAAGAISDPERHADYLAAVRAAATSAGSTW